MGRHLTQGEIEMARKVFGNSLNYNEIIIYNRSYRVDIPFTSYHIPLQSDEVAMSPNGNMYLPGRYYLADFSITSYNDPNNSIFDRIFSHDYDAYMHRAIERMRRKALFHGAQLNDERHKILRGIFIHELVHVWQYQNNVIPDLRINAVSEWLRAGFSYKDVYPYRLEYNKDLLKYNFEQQAAIIEHYYLYRFEKLNAFIYYAGVHNKDLKIILNDDEFELIPMYKSVLKNFMENPSYAKNSYLFF